MGARRYREDLRLARSAAAGRREAWERIIEAYGSRIYNLALRFTHETSAAEDVTQEIFLRLFKNLSKYRGDVPLAAWTLRLSRNLCIDRYRAARRERESIFLPEETLHNLSSTSDPQSEVQRRELLEQIDEILPELGEDAALVITLRDLQGLTYAEISAVLDVPIGTLKSRLSRARRQLIERLRARHRACEERSVVEWEAATC